MTKGSVRLHWLTGFVVATGMLAWGTAFSRQSETLRGLSGIRVVVEDIDSDVAGQLPTTDAETRLALRLRKGGVRVYSEPEMEADPSFPVLLLTVTANRCDSDGFTTFCMVDLEAAQSVTLMRSGGKKESTLAKTWETSRLVKIGRDRLQAGGLNEVLDSVADIFINDWLATHPAVATKP